MKKKNFLIFGDSIVYGKGDLEGGWVGRLRRYLEEKDPEVRVYNLGIFSNDSTDLLARFSEEARARLREDYDTTTVFAIGINDSYFVHSENKVKTAPEEFRNNILQLIEQAKVFSSKIIFVGLTPVDESKTNPIPWNTDKSYRNESIAAFNQLIETACSKLGLPFVNLLEKFKGQDYAKLLDDGLHPNSEGHKLIFETVKEAVKDI